MFSTDTGATGGFQGNVFTGVGFGNVNQTKPATVYVYLNLTKDYGGLL